MAAEDIVKHSVHTLVFRSLKRTHDMFLHNHMFPVARDSESDKLRIQCKIRDEYSAVKNLPIPEDVKINQHDIIDQHGAQQGVKHVERPPVILGAHPYPAEPGIPLSQQNKAVTREPSQAGIQQVLKALPPSRAQTEASKQPSSIMDIKRQAMMSGGQERLSGPSKALVQSDTSKLSSNAIVQKRALTMPKPEWHAPWKLMRVISGHTGWVRSVAVEPANNWFATGSADRTIKIWDLASGTLKLSLTGHISTVRGLVVSNRHPYLFSCGEDKTVKCWDLEHNKVIRSYHGHLSAVHDISLHPTIDVLITCGRDSTARVWDVRTKACVHTLAGHTNTVAVVRTQAPEPQVITGSHDCTIRLWDLAAAKTTVTLTNHKKSIRAMALHPTQYAFATASPDNIKQWKFPDGNFLQNLQGHNSIINCMTVNSDNILVTGGDNGTMYFWDWKTGYNFQRFQATAQPGSLDSESGIFAMTFDQSQSRLITCEADKTVKIYREDDTASEESHPVNWKPDIVKRKRY